MPSSTSSSNQRSANVSVALLLALLVTLLAGVELGTRLLVNSSSAVQRRVQGEDAAALSLRRAPAGSPRTILIVGNSLLLEAVDMEVLRVRIAPRWRPQRFIMESTSYLDWYFGLHRLWEEGSQPDDVLLMLSPGNFSASQTRGDYFARYLMRTRDWPAVVESSHVHPTVGSGYLLARYSDFYALRADIRKQVLLRIFPGLQQMLRMIARQRGGGDEGAGVAATRGDLLRRRALELAELSRLYSIPLQVVIPPSGTPPALAQDENVALDAITRAGLTGFRPLPSAETRPNQYADGFHLNADGRAIFTARLADAILTLR